MKKVILGLLLTSAFAFATTYTTTRTDTPEQEHHMAWYTKEALATQSPRIHLGKMKHHEVVRSGDQINVNKTTITAFVSSNK
jgi:hypothetical protein